MAIDISKLAVYLLADMSGSMNDSDGRLGHAKEIGVMFANEVVEHDDDGMLHFVTFGGRAKEIGSVGVEEIEKFYQNSVPSGGTPLAQALDLIYDDIQKRLTGPEAAHQLVAVITDGVPDDKRKVIDSIKRIAENVTSDDQLAFLFIQVGNDSNAKAYLDFLDDEVQKATNGMDLIDTVHFSEVSSMTNQELVLKAFAD